MQLNTLQSKTTRQRSTQVGRGGKRGKTSGRGMKGQNARAGNKKRPEMRDIIKKLPKLRGYRFNSYKDQSTVVTFEFIDTAFTAGETVSPKTLADKGILSAQKHTLKMVKILNKGTLTKALTFVDCFASATAQKTIVAAGGTVTLPKEKAKTQKVKVAKVKA